MNDLIILGDPRDFFNHS